MINTSQLWLLPLLLSVAAAAQLGAQQDGRIFRTEPMGNGYARTGVNTAIFRARSLVTSQLDRTVVRDPRGYAHWQMGDGLVSPWREGNRLYLFAGRSVHVMELRVRKDPDGPNPRPEGGL